LQYIALVLVVFAAELAGGIAAIVYKDEVRATAAERHWAVFLCESV